MDFEGKRATIIGLAREGTALARFLAERGGVVTVSDMRANIVAEKKQVGIMMSLNKPRSNRNLLKTLSDILEPRRRR